MRTSLRTLLLLAGMASVASAQEDQAALIAAVEDVMLRRCVPCHAPGADDEKALKDWDKADDLAASLEIEDLIAPGDPDGSDLFLTVDDGDMPPDDWDGGMCTAEEVEALRAWIAAGAPVPEPEVTAEAEDDSPAAPPKPKRNPWRNWLGKLHPAVVHFPIGLLLVALLADLLGRREAAYFCLWVGALGAIAASGLGWLAGETTPGTKAELLDLHRWSGIAVAVLAVITAVVYARCTRDDRPAGKARWLLVVLALLVSAVGHIGGELSWGEGYLDPPFMKDKK